jgi:hypothetical protein
LVECILLFSEFYAFCGRCYEVHNVKDAQVRTRSIRLSLAISFILIPQLQPNANTHSVLSPPGPLKDADRSIEEQVYKVGQSREGMEMLGRAASPKVSKPSPSYHTSSLPAPHHLDNHCRASCDFTGCLCSPNPATNRVIIARISFFLPPPPRPPPTRRSFHMSPPLKCSVRLAIHNHPIKIEQTLRFVSQNRPPAARFSAFGRALPTLARRSFPTSQPLNPSVSLLNHVPPIRIQCYSRSVSRNRAPVAPFWPGAKYSPCEDPTSLQHHHHTRNQMSRWTLMRHLPR